MVEFGNNKADQKAFLEQQEQLQVQKEVTETVEETPEVKVTNEDGILLEYEELYNQNNDMIGWLKIEDTVIDYPVMQTMDDENFYLNKNFQKEDDKNCNETGRIRICLIIMIIKTFICLKLKIDYYFRLYPVVIVRKE